MLAVFTPGFRAFDYCRLGDRVRRGEAKPTAILDAHDRFDNYFIDSPI